MKKHLVNVHIPKSAGSALRANLATLFPTDDQGRTFVLGVSPNKEREYHDGLRQGFDATLPRLFDLSHRMISGHYRYRDIADILAPYRARLSLITFLRDPAWRTLSDYYYSISTKNPGAETFHATYPTFEHYMSNPGEMNKMSDFLRLDETETVQDVLLHAYRDFDFVGITEHFTQDLEFIANSLGQTIDTERRENENKNKDKMIEAYEKFAPILRDVLSEDYTLYEGVLEHRGLSN
ncbi:sulfotransferase family 2 domain-containing protein [Pelagimonas phthalicica]|nr:sulfotransferase family 2 domain-containing protein [Pelagimonas phthalicica]